MPLRRLCSVNGLGDSGDLCASPNDLNALRVVDVFNILIFPLCLLPDFDLTATPDDTDSHGRQEVVSSVGVVVDTAVEHGCSVLADS